jgi:integrase
MLKSMFNKGLEWKMIAENPAAGIKALRENGSRTRFLDQEEIQRLLEASSQEFLPVLITALHSGMRRGEIMNLTWPDVNFKNRIITVRESKSGKKRMIPMDETHHSSLRALPSRFKKGNVFMSQRNPDKPWRDFRKPFTKALEKEGIEDVRSHDLRHTFASRLVMSGVDMKTVQELLGHSSLTMTTRYSHLAPDHRMRAVKTLDRAFYCTITAQSQESRTATPSQTIVK